MFNKYNKIYVYVSPAVQHKQEGYQCDPAE